MKKYLLTFAVALMAAFAFTACSSNDDDPPVTPKDNAPKGVEAVDLGLTVKWANMNLGATTPEGFGAFYAWGECETKSSFSWDTYFDTNDGGNTFEVYSISKAKKLILDHDAARQNWKGNWRIPTRTEIDELISKCTWTFETINGTKGCKVTGPSGKSIFLPAAGQYDSDTPSYINLCGYYLSSSIDSGNSQNCHSLFLTYNTSTYETSNSPYFAPRWVGMSVRPVCQ